MGATNTELLVFEASSPILPGPPAACWVDTELPRANHLFGGFAPDIARLGYISEAIRTERTFLSLSCSLWGNQLPDEGDVDSGPHSQIEIPWDIISPACGMMTIAIIHLANALMVEGDVHKSGLLADNVLKRPSG